MAKKIAFPILLNGDKVNSTRPVVFGNEGNQGIYELKLIRDTYWEGLKIQAIWHTLEGDIITLPENDILQVPIEATKIETKNKESWVTLLGTENIQCKVSARLYFNVNESGPISGCEGGVPSQNVIDQILNRLDAIPTKLSELEDDTEHRTVTDTEKQAWNDKQPKNVIVKRSADDRNVATHNASEIAALHQKGILVFFEDIPRRPQAQLVSAAPYGARFKSRTDGTAFQEDSFFINASGYILTEANFLAAPAVHVTANLPPELPPETEGNVQAVIDALAENKRNKPFIVSLIDGDMIKGTADHTSKEAYEAHQKGLEVFLSDGRSSKFEGAYFSENKCMFGYTSPGISISAGIVNQTVLTLQGNQITGTFNEFKTLAKNVSADVPPELPEGTKKTAQDVMNALAKKYPGIHVGPDPVPPGTKVQIDPNGQRLQVPEIRDTEIKTDDTWSSDKIVRAFCPEFKQTGPIVAGELFEGSKMGLKLNFEPIQEGTGDPSPSNVRPIKARSSVEGVHCGRNLIPWPWEQGGIDPDTGVEFDTFSARTGFVLLKANTTYTLTQEQPTVNCKLRSYDKDKVFIRGLYGTFGKAETKIITGGEEDTYIRIVVDQEFPEIKHKVWLTVGSAPTPYAPYHGEPFTVNLGQEVYGGTVDLQTGKFFALRKHRAVHIKSLQRMQDERPHVTKYLLPSLSFKLVASSDFPLIYTQDGSQFGTNASYSISVFVTWPEKKADEIDAYIKSHDPVVVYAEREASEEFQLPPDQLAQLRAYGNGDTVYTSDPACEVTLGGFADSKALIKELQDKANGAAETAQALNILTGGDSV